MKFTRSWDCLAVALLTASVCSSAAERQTITVTPAETDELLGNPGMGWQTFHRTARQDKNLPSWIPSTVHYARWGWGELEPEEGKLNTAFLDKMLEETRQAGQQLAFRVMCCSTYKGRPYHPGWLKKIGGRELLCDYNGQGPFPIPDLDDPLVLRKHLDFIKRLGERYDGHPDIDHIDLGSVGWWGEWHLSSSRNCKINTLETRKQIVEAYLTAFRKTPLVMLIGGGECLSLATSRGAGWRADCLGDMGGFSKTWCHMRQGYPLWIRQAGIQEVWKKAPVAWETCWDMRKWVAEGWSLRYIFNYALAMHGSYINNKSAPLPEAPEVRPELERFLRRLGYRLVLKQLSYPAEVAAGGKLEVAMKWQNTGSAPCYRPYHVAYRLRSDDGKQYVLTGGVSVNRWMPGSVDIFAPTFLQNPPDLPPGEVVAESDSVELPIAMPPGTYELAIAVVEQKSSKPVVRLAIKGRAADGWYPLGKLRVKQ